MLEEEAKKLLTKEWLLDEKEIVEKMIKNLVYYKKFIPKSLKTDIIAALQLCNKLKDRLDKFTETISEECVDLGALETENKPSS